MVAYLTLAFFWRGPAGFFAPPGNVMCIAYPASVGIGGDEGSRHSSSVVAGSRRIMQQAAAPCARSALAFKFAEGAQRVSRRGRFVVTSAMAGDRGKGRVVVWFRNDLRVRDNETLKQAADMCRGGAAEVLPLYCFDPRFFGTTPWGNPKTGPFRAQFQLESVLDLKKSLRALGSDLLVAVGKPEEVIAKVAPSADRLTVLTQDEVTSEERAVDAEVKTAVGSRGELRRVWGHTLYHLADLPFRQGLTDMPDVFTPFKNKVESQSRVRAELPPLRKGDLPLPSAECLAGTGLSFDFTPTYDDLPMQPKVPRQAQDPKGVLNFVGGESVALERLRYYIWGEKRLLADYFETRNGMLGGDYSTKFAPWLAHGCLSPRTIYHEIKKFEDQVVANKSTYWVIFELIWRDYYRFFALKHGNRIFHSGGVVGAAPAWRANPDLLRRWKEGRTGMPLVDANMRELAATGFMSNRGRQNVASYLVHDLGLDWRQGADWFESLLLDYDVASNWGNWVAAAGLTGGRINRFNITKQANDYDKEGDYVRHWIPEISAVSAPMVHEPWRLSAEEQAACKVQMGVDYPVPAKQTRGRYEGRDAGGAGAGPYAGRGRGGGAGRGRGRGDRDRRGSKRGAPLSDFERYS